MIFVFRADEAGSYSLKFNRQDFVRDYVINDYVRVTVLEPPEITGSVWHSTAVAPDRVYAEPRWPPAEGVPSGGLNPAAAQTGQASPDQAAAAQAGQAAVDQAAAAQAGQAAVDQPAAAQTGQAAPDQAAATQTGQAAVLPAGSAPDVYLGRAKEEYDAGRIAGVLEALDQFRTAYPAGSDEAYWLYGQALEAAGPNRDIRLALDYYRRLVREYPQSFRYDAAARRIAYLERFYFNIQ
jgi:hypothetical protein